VIAQSVLKMVNEHGSQLSGAFVVLGRDSLESARGLSVRVNSLGHQGTVPPVSKKPPVGASSETSAWRTVSAAPSSTV